MPYYIFEGELKVPLTRVRAFGDTPEQAWAAMDAGGYTVIEQGTEHRFEHDGEDPQLDEPELAPQGLDPGDDESDGEGDDELGDDADEEHDGELDDMSEHQLRARDLFRPDQLRPDYHRFT